MARKFLYIVAVLIGLVIAAAIAYRLFGLQLMRMAMVPSTSFAAPAPLAPDAYADEKMWITRPGKPENPARWQPAGLSGSAAGMNANVFFIHPTSYFNRTSWNAPLDDAEANARAEKFVRAEASAFADAETMWVPRYRQATLGAFLTAKPESQRAFDAAYGDVLAAFDYFLAQLPANAPIILAAHSQGSMHLLRLLKDRIAGQATGKRIIAVYAVGWPVTMNADLPALGLPGCTAPEQTGCILSWQSYAEPAEYEGTMDLFESTTGLAGRPRKGDRYLCVNPLTGIAGASAKAAENLGMVKFDGDFEKEELVKAGAPARCDAKGFLLIGPGPDLGPYVMPNNNYHMYDYGLFWMNIRADAARRAAAYRNT